jgi:hypothetical protein
MMQTVQLADSWRLKRVYNGADVEGMKTILRPKREVLSITSNVLKIVSNPRPTSGYRNPGT